MILRGIVGLALLPVLVSLYVAGAVMGLLWIGVVAGWHSAGAVIDWIVGDTHTWKVTIQRVRIVPAPPHRRAPAMGVVAGMADREHPNAARPGVWATPHN